MFKISSKSFTQQRAVLKPMKNVAIFEEAEEEEEEEDGSINEEDEIYIDDGSSSCYSNGLAMTTHDSRNETMLLAQFLSSTGPEEYAATTNVKQDNKTQQQFKRASRLLNRLRKRPTMPVLRSGPTTTVDHQQPPQPMKRTHIPLPVYESLNNNNNSISTSAAAGVSNFNYNKTPVTTSTNTPPIKTSSFTSAPITTKKASVVSNTTLRDSGIYSETTSDKDSSVVSGSTNYTSTIPLPPLLPFTTVLNDLQNFPQPPYAYKNNGPRRPAPLPPAIASAAIATACSPTSVCSTSTNTPTIRSVPQAALKRRSVRLRHVQVQTDMGTSKQQQQQQELDVEVPAVAALQQLQDKQACPHCRQVVSTNKESGRIRRPSCPPALSSGPILTISSSSYEGDDNEEGRTDAKALLAMIMKLKSQLAEEKQCRIKLEKAMYQRQSDDRREQLAKERDRWAGDCLWLNDRIALLPE